VAIRSQDFEFSLFHVLVAIQTKLLLTAKYMSVSTTEWNDEITMYINHARVLLPASVSSDHARSPHTHTNLVVYQLYKKLN